MLIFEFGFLLGGGGCKEGGRGVEDKSDSEEIEMKLKIHPALC